LLNISVALADKTQFVAVVLCSSKGSRRQNEDDAARCTFSFRKFTYVHYPHRRQSQGRVCTAVRLLFYAGYLKNWCS